MVDGENKELARAKNAAYRYLALRPRSRAEVEKRLEDREFSEEVIKSAIDHLAHLGYLDDARFARQWASARVRLRGFGRRRIEQELRSKGIGRDIIEETFDGLFEDASEAEVARREADKRLKNLGRFEPEVRRRRLAGFLERKGFSFEIIRTIIRAVR
jgi:regulatory protein